jgi:thiamine biosynthesis lipoprotein
MGIPAIGRCAAAVLALAAGLPAAGEPWPIVTRARFLMGTTCEIRAFDTDAVDTGRAIDAALDRMAALEDVMTTWRADGELARLDATCAGGAASAAVSDELARILAGAREWAASTGGAFDPTVGALVTAWGLREGGRVPDRRTLARARTRTSWKGFDVDVAARRVRCAPGVELDLGGYGKGVALDAAAAVLRAHGIGAALLNFGGQVLALGAPPGEQGWIVDLADPAARDRPVAALTLRDASIATSSNAERGFVARGRRFGHVLDPRSGRPVRWRAAASVVAPTAAAADALSTALLVAGCKRADELVPRGASFVALERRGRRTHVACGSPALVARLAWHEPGPAHRAGRTRRR